MINLEKMTQIKVRLQRELTPDFEEFLSGVTKDILNLLPACEYDEMILITDEVILHCLCFIIAKIVCLHDDIQIDCILSNMNRLILDFAPHIADTLDKYFDDHDETE